MGTLFGIFLVACGLNAQVKETVFTEQDIKPNFTTNTTTYANQLGLEVGVPLSKKVTATATSRLGINYKDGKKLSTNSMNFAGASYKLGNGALGLSGSWNAIRQPNGMVANELGVFAPYSIRFKLFGKNCNNVISPWYIKPLGTPKNVYTLFDKFSVIWDKHWATYVQGFITRTIMGGMTTPMGGLAPDETSAVIRVGAAYTIPNGIFKRQKARAQAATQKTILPTEFAYR